MSGDDDDRMERSRVYGKIAPLILNFSRDHAGRQFSAEQLLHYVRKYVPNVAPDSPGRILRELRLEFRLNYLVINRRQSLYMFIPKNIRYQK